MFSCTKRIWTQLGANGSGRRQGILPRFDLLWPHKRNWEPREILPGKAKPTWWQIPLRRIVTSWMYLDSVLCSLVYARRVYKQKRIKNHRSITPASSKKQPSTWNHVIGVAEHHQQKWLLFLKAAKHKIRRQHWIGGRRGHDVCSVVLHGISVFFDEPGICDLNADHQLLTQGWGKQNALLNPILEKLYLDLAKCCKGLRACSLLRRDLSQISTAFDVTHRRRLFISISLAASSHRWNK